MVLYEDELADSGVSLLTVKVVSFISKESDFNLLVITFSSCNSYFFLYRSGTGDWR